MRDTHVRLFALIPLLALAACSSDERPTPTGPGPADPGPAADVTPPQVHILFPVDAAEYDRNGDGLSDFRVTYRDTEGTVDVDRIEVRSVFGHFGSAGESRDLLQLWNVKKKDAIELVFSERIEHLMRPGTTRIEVRVPDKAGNVGVASVDLAVRHGEYHKAISTGQPWRILRMAYCDDDQRLYAPAAQGGMAIIDGRSLELVTTVAQPGERYAPVCVPGDSLLYVSAVDLERFNRVTMQWTTKIGGMGTIHGAALSRKNPNLMYLGQTSAQVAVVDLVSDSVISTILPPVADPLDGYVWDIVVHPNDRFLSITREARTWVVDPETESAVKYIWSSNDLDITPDGSRVYGVSGRHMTEYDGLQGTVTRSMILPDLAQYVAVSPDGRSLFLTAGLWRDERNMLVDVASRTVVQFFDRPVPPSVLQRIDAAPTYTSDGNVVFVARSGMGDAVIDVYLDRR